MSGKMLIPGGSFGGFQLAGRWLSFPANWLCDGGW